MISLSQACQTIAGQIEPVCGTQSIPLADALYRVLAQPAYADIDQPPFRKSAMDGYACRQEDLPGPLHILETLSAGDNTSLKIGPGQCAQIFTGARVPEGADCVIMQEYVSILPGNAILFNGKPGSSNICQQGEDAKIGSLLLAAGQRLLPHHLALLSSAGIIQPQVFRKPEIGIICTGSELVDASQEPQGAAIRNTNIHQLYAQVVQAGGLPCYYGTFPDQPALLLEKIGQAAASCDMVITTGGASVGQYDLIPQVFSQFGAQVHFNALAIQPGKPVIFASLGNKALWGLSGNPVSSMLQFLLAVKPSIAQLSGAAASSSRPMLAAASTFSRKKPERDLFVPMTITPQGAAAPLPYNGSAHIAGLASIAGFARIPAGVLEIKEASLIECILL